MAPFRVRPSDLVFNVDYLVKTDAITEVRVAAVLAGSAAEKIGIRKGDRLTALNGVPLEGKLRRAFADDNGRMKVAGRLTFEGTRGFFRKAWSVTVESASLQAEKGVLHDPAPGHAPKPSPDIDRK